MTVRVEHGDMLDVIPRLVAEGIVCDSVVTDPPYHLLPTQKRFGATNSAPAQHGRDGAMARLSGGFMGQKWDGGDIAFRPETWATVATIMRPGAFLVAFGGTRSSHRMISAIEDAGFVIQDKLLWLFAVGFPKRKDMLKPAYEDICLAYKPGGKRTMQIDECRIEIAPADLAKMEGRSGGSSDQDYRMFDGGIKPRQLGETWKPEPAGRWPANILHDGSDEVVACFPQSGNPKPARSGIKGGENACFMSRGDGSNATHIGFWPADEGGSAARFFFSAKAGAEDRFGSRHPTVKPVGLMKWLVALVTPPAGLVLDPFAGSGTTGVAALASGRNAILIEREDSYIADIRERVAFYEGDGRHSLASKARHIERPRGDAPLFDEAAE